MSKNKVSINISNDLYKQVKQRVKDSNGEFKDVEDYVEFVLTEISKDEEEEEQEYSKEDEEQIKQRPKSLRYL